MAFPILCSFLSEPWLFFMEQVVDFSDVQFHQISKDKVHCKGAKPSNPCRPEKLLQLFPNVCSPTKNINCTNLSLSVSLLPSRSIQCVAFTCHIVGYLLCYLCCWTTETFNINLV
jgi:hypothetical protein